MKNKIKKYSKAAVVATLVPVTFSVGLSNQTTDAAFAATPELKVTTAKTTGQKMSIASLPKQSVETQVQPQATVETLAASTVKLTLKVTTIGSADRQIKGTATASTLESRKVVEVVVGGATLTTEVSPTGEWVINLPETVILNSGDSVNVKVTDGTTSSKKTVKVAQSAAAPIFYALQPYAQKFIGKGIPGYTIHLYKRSFQDPNFEEFAKTKVDNFGNWTISSNEFFAEEWSQYQAVQEKNGISSYASQIVKPYDTVAPDAPYVTEGIYDNSIVIRGGGNEKGEIIAKFPNGSEVRSTFSRQNWEVYVPEDTKLVAGDMIDLQLVDYNGNISQHKYVTVLASETTPTAPTVDRIITDQTTVSGTGVAGNTVKVTFENGQVVATKVATDGSWSVNVPSKLKLKSKNKVSVAQINPQGIKSGETVVEVQIGQVDAPTVNPIVEGDSKVRGTGKPGATVIVYYYPISDERRSVAEATVDKNGNWSASLETAYMTFGHEVNVTQQYDGALSGTVRLYVAAATKLPTPKVNDYYEGKKTITGKGIVGSTITVTLPNGKTLTAIVDNVGKWSISVPADAGLKEGEKFTVTQTSTSGAISAAVKVYV